VFADALAAGRLMLPHAVSTTVTGGSDLARLGIVDMPGTEMDG